MIRRTASKSLGRTMADVERAWRALRARRRMPGLDLGRGLHSVRADDSARSTMRQSTRQSRGILSATSVSGNTPLNPRAPWRNVSTHKVIFKKLLEKRVRMAVPFLARLLRRPCKARRTSD